MAYDVQAFDLRKPCYSFFLAKRAPVPQNLWLAPLGGETPIKCLLAQTALQTALTNQHRCLLCSLSFPWDVERTRRTGSWVVVAKCSKMRMAPFPMLRRKLIKSNSDFRIKNCFNILLNISEEIWWFLFWLIKSHKPTPMKGVSLAPVDRKPSILILNKCSDGSGTFLDIMTDRPTDRPNQLTNGQTG